MHLTVSVSGNQNSHDVKDTGAVKWGGDFGDGPNTVSESTVSKTKLSKFLWSSPSSGQRLNAKPNSPHFLAELAELLQNSVSSLFRKSTLETVFCLFPMIDRDFHRWILEPFLLPWWALSTLSQKWVSKTHQAYLANQWVSL